MPGAGKQRVVVAGCPVAAGPRAEAGHSRIAPVAGTRVDLLHVAVRRRHLPLELALKLSLQLTGDLARLSIEPILQRTAGTSETA